MGSDAQLAAHELSKLGQTCVFVCLWTEFLHAELQVSTCSSYVCHPG